jgi:hypothetical protein
MSLGHYGSGFTVPMFDTAPSMVFAAAYLSSALSCLLSAGALSSEARNFGLKLIAFKVEPVDDVALFAQFNKLIGNFVSKLLNSYLQPPSRHRELRTQQILISPNFRLRLRKASFQPPYCQPNRAVLNEWYDGDRQEAPK